MLDQVTVNDIQLSEHVILHNQIQQNRHNPQVTIHKKLLKKILDRPRVKQSKKMNVPLKILRVHKDFISSNLSGDKLNTLISKVKKLKPTQN